MNRLQDTISEEGITISEDVTEGDFLYLDDRVLKFKRQTVIGDYYFRHTAVVLRVGNEEVEILLDSPKEVLRVPYRTGKFCHCGTEMMHSDENGWWFCPRCES